MDIAIITHAQDLLFVPTAGRSLASEYMLGAIARALADDLGHRVRVYQGIPPRLAPADLAVMHVDLTRVPPEYVAFGATFPQCLNLRVADISKRSMSGALLGAAEPWDGPVITKSNRNFGGLPEQRLHRLAAAHSGSATSPEPRVVSSYSIYGSRTAVPAEVRADPDMVVEKFLPERDGAAYVTRFWGFCGDAERSYRVWSDDPIVKSTNAKGMAPCEVPEALRARRLQLGIDYGKIDYVMHEGAPVVIDVNKTPGQPPVVPGSQWAREYAKALARCAP